MIRIGCSGWNYRSRREALHPKGLPASRSLEHDASAFHTVEVNATFTDPRDARGWSAGWLRARSLRRGKPPLLRANSPARAT